MKVLTGKQAVFYIRIDSTFYPVLCAISVSFQFDVEEVLTTTRTSGLYRTRKGRLRDWSVSGSGLTKLDNTDGQIGWFWLLQNIGTSQYMRIRYTDADGNVKNVEGYILIKQGQLGSEVSGFSTASYTFPGSGAFTTDSVPGITLPELYKIYLATTEGAYEVTANELGGATEIMLVLREEGGYKEVAGTPVGRQFKFIDNTSSGTIRFASSLPFNAGEIVYVQYKKPA